MKSNNTEKDFIISTTPTLEGYRITKYIGILPISSPSSRFFDISLYAMSVNDKIKKLAMAMGGNAVVGMTYTTKMEEVLGIGTVVWVEKIDENKEKQKIDEPKEKPPINEVFQHTEDIDASLKLFLDKASTCQRIKEVLAIWNSFDWDSSVSAVIGKKINDYAEVERLYGGSSKRVQKLFEDIEKVIERSKNRE